MRNIRNLKARIERLTDEQSPDREAIVADFINQLPRELHDAVLKYIKSRVQELEGEEKSS